MIFNFHKKNCQVCQFYSQRDNVSFIHLELFYILKISKTNSRNTFNKGFAKEY